MTNLVAVLISPRSRRASRLLAFAWHQGTAQTPGNWQPKGLFALSAYKRGQCGGVPSQRACLVAGLSLMPALPRSARIAARIGADANEQANSSEDCKGPTNEDTVHVEHQQRCVTLCRIASAALS